MARRAISVLVILALFASLAGGYLYGVIGGPITAPSAAIIAPAGGPVPPARTVVILGTSLTSRGTWVDELQRQLLPCAPGLSIERLAQAGQSSGWGLSAWRDRLKERAPDVLIVEYSINDASLVAGFPLWLSRANHLKIINSAHRAGVKVFLATMNPAYDHKAWFRPGQRRYQALYRDLSAKTGAGLVDTTPQWDALSAELRQRWQPDGVHPSDKAMAAITVPTMAAALTPLVCGKT